MDLVERGGSDRRHPWETQRFEAYRRILADHRALTARRVLDVGAGDGWFGVSLLEHLPADAAIVCWDTNYSDDDLGVGSAGVTRTRDRPEPGFDLVLVLDVLEHVDDVEAFVSRELVPLAGQGTVALVSVPAMPRLFSTHDEALGHHRRYTRRGFHAQVAPWIDVIDHGSLFASLVPARAASVAAERLGRRPAAAGVGGWAGGPTVTAVVDGALGLDARVGRALARVGVRLPGLSHWVVGVVR